MSVELGYFAASTETSTSSTTARSASDFDVFSITAPSDSRLPDGGDARSAASTTSSRRCSHPADNYITFAKDYGKRIEHWDGFDLILTARPQGGVTLQGG